MKHKKLIIMSITIMLILVLLIGSINLMYNNNENSNDNILKSSIKKLGGMFGLIKNNNIKHQNHLVKVPKWHIKYSTDKDYNVVINNKYKKDSEICLISKSKTKLNEIPTAKKVYDKKGRVKKTLTTIKRNGKVGYCITPTKTKDKFIKFGEHSTVLEWLENNLEIRDENNNLIAEYGLIENTEKCIINCHATGEVTFYHPSKLFDGYDFQDLDNNEMTNLVDVEILILNNTYYENKTHYVYLDNCTDNGGVLPDCTRYLNNTYTTEELKYNWVKYNNELINGTKKWKIKGTKLKRLNIDWSIASNGINTSEFRKYWATWNDSFTDNITLYYKLNETSGTNALDSVAGEYNMTVHNSSAWTTGGLYGGAYHYNNEDPTPFGYPLWDLDAMTVNFWIRRTGELYDGSFSYVIAANGSNSGDWWVLHSRNSAGANYLRLGINDGGSWGYIDADTDDLSLNQWEMVTVVLSKTQVKLYLNATYVGQRGLSSFNVKREIGFGPLGGGSTNEAIHNADIDEVSIWYNRSFSQSEIEDLYANGEGMTYNNETAPASNINVTLNSPINHYNSSNKDITFNCSATEDNGVLNLSLIVDSVIKTTVTNTTDNENLSLNYEVTGLSEGDHEWNCTAYDTTGTKGLSNSRTLTVDSIPPDVNIVYPMNISYNYNVSELNYTTSDATIGLDSCWYSIDNGQTNSTPVNAGVNFNNVQSSEGTNTWTVYCNDTLNNINDSEKITFVKDTTAPTFDNLANQQMFMNQNFNYDINASDSSGIDSYTINWTTTFSINSSTGVIINTSGLNEGYYYFNVSVNDTLGNINYGTFYLEVLNVTSRDLLVNGTTKVLSGNRNYDTITVINNGIIKVDDNIGWLNLSADYYIYVDSSSSIEGNELGYYSGGSGGSGGAGEVNTQGANGVNGNNGSGYDGNGAEGGKYGTGGVCNVAGGSGGAGGVRGDILGTISDENEVSLQYSGESAGGGGGGGGGCDTGGVSGNGGTGGNGGRSGAVIKIWSRNITINGLVNTTAGAGGNGGVGGSSSYANSFCGGGGGGGAGGSAGQIILYGSIININNAVLESQGGNGGNAGNGGTGCTVANGGNGVAGEGGAGGRIKIFYANLDNSSTNLKVNGGDGVVNGTVYYSTIDAYPTVTLNSPDNSTKFNNNNITLNCSATDNENLTLTKLFVNGDNVYNSTNGNIYYNKLFNDGYYNWTCEAIDNNSKTTYGFPNRTFSVDTIKPTINIISPSGYYGVVQYNKGLDLNWSVSDDNLDSCWYEYLGVNNTVNCSNNHDTINITSVDNNKLMFYANDSYGNINNASTSWIVIFIENNVSYNNISAEGTTENYNINLTYDSSKWSSILSEFYYNNSQYSSTTTANGDNVILSSSLQIPELNGNDYYPFYWMITLSNSSGTYYYNTTTHNQYINPILFSLCNSTNNVTFVNFTIKDYNGNIINSSFSAKFILRGSRNYTYEDTSETANSFAFCAIPTYDSYSSYANIEFYANGYAKNYYYLINNTLTNNTQNITLYLLNDSEATLTEYQLVDRGQAPISNLYITIQKYDATSDTYYTVAMAKTSDNGNDVVSLNWYDTFYKEIITDGNEVLKITLPHKIFETPQKYTILSDISYDYDKFKDIDYTLSFNNATNNFILTYVLPSGAITDACLRVTKRTLINDTIICDQCEQSSSATIYCNINGYGNGTYIGTFYAKGSYSYMDSIQEFIGEVNEIYNELGNMNGTFYALMFGILIISLFLFSPSLAIIGSLLGVLAGMIIGFQPLNYMEFIGLVIIGGVLITIMKR